MADYQQFNQPPQQQGFNQPPQQGFNQPPQQGFNQAPQQYNPPPMQNPNQPPQNQPLLPQESAKIGGGMSFSTPIDKVMNMGGIFIKQQVNVVEALTGCVQQNRYDVFSADQNGEQNSTLPFVKIKENSSCLQRQCLPSQCRAYELNFTVNFETIPGSGQWQEQLCVQARKECSCTFFCCNRPVLEIFLNNSTGGQQKIGEIRNPFRCCDLIVEAHQEQKNMDYKVIGSCCQLGVLCPWPCKPCQEVDFDIINAAGEKIVPLKKKSPGCWRACLGPTDYFSVIFPAKANRDDRLLVIASALMLDYMYFNDRPEDNKNSGNQI